MASFEIKSISNKLMFQDIIKKLETLKLSATYQIKTDSILVSGKRIGEFEEITRYLKTLEYNEDLSFINFKSANCEY